jgi:hypothetical protein
VCTEIHGQEEVSDLVLAFSDYKSNAFFTLRSYSVTDPFVTSPCADCHLVTPVRL